MKRRRSGHASRKRKHIAVTVAAVLSSLVIGPQNSFHKPVSAAVKTTTEIQTAALTTDILTGKVACPELKTKKTRPVHPAVFDKDYFRKRVAMAVQMKPAQKPKIQKKIVKRDKSENFYHTLIEKIADLHEIDPALIKAIVKAESSYNPQAVSTAGAMGLMQLMPATAAEVGVTDSFNPEDNLHGGIKYYKKMLKRFEGDIELALAAYNAGSGAVINHKGVPPYKETRQYIERVKTYYEEYKKQADTDGKAISPDAVQALYFEPEIPAIRGRQPDIFHA